jgi:hypothetical protein
MSRMLEALRRIEARRPLPEDRPDAASPPGAAGRFDETAVEAALERAEAAAALAAAWSDDPALACLDEAVGQSCATAVQPLLAFQCPQECAVPPAGPPLEWPVSDVEHEVTQPEEPRATGRDRVTATTPPAVPAGEGSEAYQHLAERIASAIRADAGAVLMFASPLRAEDTAELLDGLAPALARLAGTEPLRVDASGGGLHLDRRLDELRRDGRLVLLDAGPLCRPRAAQFVRHCDGAYLVIRPAQTPARALREAVRALHAQGSTLVGRSATPSHPAISSYDGPPARFLGTIVLGG